MDNTPTPGADPPERHLQRRRALLGGGMETLTTSLREVEARRQESHTGYLEDRS